MWPEHTLKARFTGWPDGELMAFDIINSDEQRVGYFILTTDGKWMRVNWGKVMKKARYGGPCSILEKEEREKNTQNRKPKPVSTRSHAWEVLRTEMRYEEIRYSRPDEMGCIEIHSLKREDWA